LSWRIPAAVVALCALGGLGLFLGFPEHRTSGTNVQAADPVPEKSPAVASPVEAPPAASSTRVDIKANEPAWVSIYENDKLTFARVLEPGQTKTVESSGKVRLQLGNAGGVELTVNGKPSGALGRKGQVRILEVTADGFQPVESKPKKP
jgi:cytoskeleton protein RodZ